jgi:hypothetical protein
LVQAREVGLIKRVTVRLVERGVGAAWQLDKVVILNKNTGKDASRAGGQKWK